MRFNDLLFAGAEMSRDYLSHEYLFLSNVDDTSGNARNGTNVNGTYTTGADGTSNSAIQWGATAGGVQMPVVTQNPTAFSLHFKWRATGLNDSTRILWGHRDEPTRLIQIACITSADVTTVFLQARSSASSLKTSTSYTLPNATSWHSFALVFDKSNSSIALYVDKVKVTELTNSWGSETFTSTKQTINGYNNGSSQYSGYSIIDDFRFYDGYLFTQQDIDTLYDL